MFVHLPDGVKCKDVDKKREALKVQLEWNRKLNRELTVLDDEIPKDIVRLERKLCDLVSPVVAHFSKASADYSCRASALVDSIQSRWRGTWFIEA